MEWRCLVLVVLRAGHRRRKWGFRLEFAEGTCRVDQVLVEFSSVGLECVGTGEEFYLDTGPGDVAHVQIDQGPYWVWLLDCEALRLHVYQG